MSKPKPSSYWNKQAILSRIADQKKRIRYEAGSPDRNEVGLYRSSLLSGLSPAAARKKRILVLGMTPEIRMMALHNEFKVISIDHNPEVIQMYKDWIPEEYEPNETIIQGSWWDIGEYITEPVYAVTGDGVFGNILSVEKHDELLMILKSVLEEKGLMVFRKILVPDGFDIPSCEADLLIHKYRSGGLTDAEFGFAMRIWGNFSNSWNPQNFILDNGRTFRLYKKWVKEGLLSESEYDCIAHYYFEGENMVLPQQKWEEILNSSGCSFASHRLKGKDWYAYYPVYTCRF